MNTGTVAKTRNTVVLFATLLLFWTMLMGSMQSDSLLVGALVSLVHRTAVPQRPVIFHRVPRHPGGIRRGPGLLTPIFFRNWSSPICGWQRIVLSPGLADQARHRQGAHRPEKPHGTADAGQLDHPDPRHAHRRDQGRMALRALGHGGAARHRGRHRARSSPVSSATWRSCMADVLIYLAAVLAGARLPAGALPLHQGPGRGRPGHCLRRPDHRLASPPSCSAALAEGRASTWMSRWSTRCCPSSA